MVLESLWVTTSLSCSLQRLQVQILTYIPASGGVDALRMVKAGETVAGFNNLSDSARSAADLKILAVADLTRHEYLPDVPTLHGEWC